MGKLLTKQFSVTDLQGLSLWLKADAGVNLAGSNVTSWIDQSANAYQFTPPLDQNYPTFKNSFVNGKPVIEFTRSSSQGLSNDGVLFEDVFTFFSVTKQKPTNGPGRTFSSYYNNVLIGTWGTGPTAYSNRFFGGDDNGWLIDGTNTSTNWLLTTATANSVGGTFPFSFSQNGATPTAGTSDFSVVIDGVSIGGGYYANGSAPEPSDSYIAEIIIYNRVLTEIEREKVEAYLNAKYAIYTPILNTKISIKKQNAISLKPYSITGGSTVYDPNAVYIFKGGSINTVSTVFNYLELQGGSSYSTADGIYIPSLGSYVYYKNSGIGGTGWRTNGGADATNLVINNNDLIYFTPRSYKEISVDSGAIIQKYYSGKISLYKKFAPNTLQGLSLWLKADAGVTLAGSNVTAWVDQSVNGRNATPNDPANKPLFNASDKNGKPTISLTSMSDYVERVFAISSNPLGASGSTAFSVQYVEDVCGAFDDNGPIFGNFGGSEDSASLSQTHYPYGPDCSVYDAFGTRLRKNGITPPVTITNAWTLYSVKSTDNDWQSFVNGQLMYSDPTNTYSSAIGGDDTTLYIGKQTANGTFSLKGKVAEVIVYNRVLTTTERQQVEAYLNDKYNIY